jgi:hypothetical protein
MPKLMDSVRTPSGTYMVEIDESNQLTHIDAFLVTVGDRMRVTLSARLSSQDKQQGVRELLNSVKRGSARSLVWRRSQGVAAS